MKRHKLIPQKAGKGAHGRSEWRKDDFSCGFAIKLFANLKLLDAALVFFTNLLLNWKSEHTSIFLIEATKTPMTYYKSVDRFSRKLQFSDHFLVTSQAPT